MNYLKILFLLAFLNFVELSFASVHTIVPKPLQLQKNSFNNVQAIKKAAPILSKTKKNRPETIQKKPKDKWRVFTILMVPALALTVIAAALPYLGALILFYIAGVLFIAALLALAIMSIPPIKKKKPKTTEPQKGQ